MCGCEMKAGDRIRIQLYGFGGYKTEQKDYTVELFRYCLGVFLSEQAREAGDFTPLCELYGPGPNSEEKYIPNYGEYITNKVPEWMDIP